MTPKSHQSLDSYFSRLRDKVENAEQDYPRLTSVREGESTLEDIAGEYETRFSQLLDRKAIFLDKLRIRKQQDEFVRYAQELEQFIDILTNLSRKSGFTSYSPQDYYSPLSRYRRQRYGEVGEVIWGGIALGSIGAIILSFFIPPLWLPILIGGELGAIVSLIGSPAHVDKKGKSSAENFFSKLQEYAGTVDKEVHSAYILDYFADNRDLFSKFYKEMDELNRQYVYKKLQAMQELGMLDMSSVGLESFLEDCAKGGMKNGN